MRRVGAAPGSAAGDRLFTCDLSGQDFWKLLQSSHQPVGLVIGYCAYAAEPDSALSNREVAGPTRAIYTARRLAVARMRDEAGRLAGTAIAPVTDTQTMPPSATVLGL